MSVKSFTRSFAGGEIAPILYGRIDLAKFQTGLAKCLNFLVTPQGPIENRPGFEYILRAKDSATRPALIPFNYNSEQSFALEFGAGYIRFHTQGGTLLEASKAVAGVTLAAPGVFNVVAHGYAVGQWLFLGTIGGMPDLTSRWAIVDTVPDADHFTLVDLFAAPISTFGMPAYTGGGTVARVYEIATPYIAVHLFDLHYVQSADVLTITHQSYAPRELRRLGATNWTLSAIIGGASIATPAVPTTATGGPGGGTPLDHGYIVTALAEGTLEESGPSPAVVVNIDLTVAGNYVDVTPAAVAGAIRYNVYKQKGGIGIAGFIGQTDGTAFRDTNFEPDTSQTPPIDRAPFASESPAAVGYFEQRRCFGGGGVNTQTLWTTRSATERNFSYSIPQRDDDAITARIVARDANVIRHLIPFEDLVALTSGGVWRISPASGDVLTPASIAPKQHSAVGASMVTPILTSMSVLYAPARGSHIHELTFQWQAQRYKPEDVSILAPHLFDFRTVTQMAYSTTPYQVLWAVRDDGVLLGLTYQPEHEVKAWHQHTTRGTFASVCTIPEGNDDAVYVIVQRSVQGHLWHYVERMHRRQFEALEDAFFVDAGASYDGPPATVIRGLWHLEGLEVALLADGGVEPVQTVTGGKVTLETAASKVQIGLAYNADAQSMPLAVERLAAFGQDVTKNINEVALRVHFSSSIKAGPSFDNLRPYVQRNITDDYGTPPGLKTGIARFKITPTWQDNGSVCVRQSDPLPLTLLSLTLDTSIGG